MILKELIDRLKEKGCRMTPQRTIIIGILTDHQYELISVETLLIEAKKVNPAINATTIYRNLELLDELNLIYSQNGKDGSKLFKLVCHNAHHHHIICKDCGKMLPIDFCPVAPQLVQMVADKGFTLEEHHLELYGYCSDCQEKKTT